MKKITLLLLICTGIWISSCDKYLDVQPANVKAIGSLNDVKGVLGGYLLSIAEANLAINYEGNGYTPYWYEDIGFMLDSDAFRMFSYYDNTMDHTYSFRNLDRLSVEEEYIAKALTWSSIEVHGQIWKQGYKNIGLMNRILGEIARLNEPDSELKQQLMGEAKVVRAWNAMKLLQLFTPFTNDALGIPLKFDSQDLISSTSERITQTEVYEMIISELKDVLAYTAPTNENYNVFYRKKFIHGILSQLYTYKATGPVRAEDDWGNARTHALAALEGKYLASNAEEIKSMFFATETKAVYDSPFAQVLFFWGSTVRPDIYQQWGFPIYRDLGYGDRYAGRPLNPDFLSLFEEDDYRIQEKVFIWNDTYKENNKYSTSSPVRNTYQMIRTAELHLIVAETYAREGDDAMAKQWLDEFKASRNTSNYSSTDVLTEIMNERTKEFMSEYDIIWLDLKRNEMSLTHTYLDPLGGTQTFTLESNDYRFAFYIPVDIELSLNPNLEQNPGW